MIHMRHGPVHRREKYRGGSTGIPFSRCRQHHRFQRVDHNSKVGRLRQGSRVGSGDRAARLTTPGPDALAPDVKRRPSIGCLELVSPDAFSSAQTMFLTATPMQLDSMRALSL
jgi:hypothetical protein